MFTGLVEATGTVMENTIGADGARLVVRSPLPAMAVGESMAVDGCCLTAVFSAPGTFAADVLLETLSRTTLGDRAPGERVNLERAAVVGQRLGGHVVLGHVDGTSAVRSVVREGDGRRLRLEVADDDAIFVVPKGSVAIDGVSLTVAALGPGWLDVALVAHTLSATTLGELEAGDRVNVEWDVLGKQVLRAVALSGRVVLSPGARRRLGLPADGPPSG